MKLLSLATGFLLILSLLTLSGWYLLSSNSLVIQEIDCKVVQENCSQKLVEELNSQLLGTSFFVTDFKQVVSIPNLRVASFSKKFPGKLVLTVEAKQDQLTATTFAESSTPEEIQTFLQDYLREEKIEVTGIETYPVKNLVTATINDLQILLTISNLESDANKVILIINYLDIENIDLAIIEVDARYKLPVLRTNKSNF